VRAPGETLAQMKSRGTAALRRGEGIPGFSEKDSAGRWYGFDVISTVRWPPRARDAAKVAYAAAGFYPMMFADCWAAIRR